MAGGTASQRDTLVTEGSTPTLTPKKGRDTAAQSQLDVKSRVV